MQGVTHRDLKLENFMFAIKDDLTSLKMIDFGLSKKEDSQSKQELKPIGRRSKRRMNTRAGTSYYVAPEVLTGSYDNKCDVWSAGVILYLLLCGYPPFQGANDWEILLEVKRGKFSMKGAEWKYVTDNAKDLLRRMICPAGERLTTSRRCCPS